MIDSNSTIQPLRVLLIEDSEVDVLISSMAVDDDLSVLPRIEKVRSLSLAIERIEYDKWSLVLLDLSYPLKDSIRMLNTYYSHCDKVPMMALTSVDGKAVGEEALRRGAIGFMSKQEIGPYLQSPAIHCALERWQRNSNQEGAIKDLDRIAHVAEDGLTAPLRTIQSYCAVLEEVLENEEGGLSEETRDHLLEIETSVERADCLLSDLLRFCRLGEASIKRQKIPLKTVIDMVKVNLQVEIEAAAAKIEVSQLPEIEADPDLIVHVFQNLMANCIGVNDACSPRIEISFDRSKNIIAVAPAAIDGKRHLDTPNERGELGDRTDGESRFEDSGQGLSICKRIVDAHGGCVWVETNRQGGSTFCLTLPTVH